MSSIPHKRCSTCGAEKPLSEFKRDGKASSCKECRTASERARRAAMQQDRAAPPEYKACSCCGEDKPASAFNRNISTRDGLHAECKECSRIQRRARRVRNPERVKALDRASRERHSKRRSVRAKEWIQEHAGHVQQRGRMYRQQRRDHYRQLKRRWYRAHPEYEVRRSHIRRQRVASAQTHYTIAEWRKLRKGFGNACLRCGAMEDLTIDHVVPLVLGGSNHISNLQLLCRTCNSWKNARIMDFRP